MRPLWDRIKDDVMLTIVRAKFMQNRNLEIKLLETKDAELVEGNWWHDQVWGNCTCGGLECRLPGLNHLGKILMKVRDELRLKGRSYEDERQVRPEAGPQSHLPGV